MLPHSYIDVYPLLRQAGGPLSGIFVSLSCLRALYIIIIAGFFNGKEKKEDNTLPLITKKLKSRKSPPLRLLVDVSPWNFPTKRKISDISFPRFRIKIDIVPSRADVLLCKWNFWNRCSDIRTWNPELLILFSSWYHIYHIEWWSHLKAINYVHNLIFIIRLFSIIYMMNNTRIVTIVSQSNSMWKNNTNLRKSNVLFYFVIKLRRFDISFVALLL